MRTALWLSQNPCWWRLSPALPLVVFSWDSSASLFLAVLSRLCCDGFSLVTVWGRLFAAGSLVEEHRLQEVRVGS